MESFAHSRLNFSSSLPLFKIGSPGAPAMNSMIVATFRRVLNICAMAIVLLAFVVGAVQAEEKAAESVYRVATETTAAQPGTIAQTVGASDAKATSRAPLDFTKQDKEH